MKTIPLLLALCLAATSSVRAQTTVFNDTFGGGSTINSNPTSPANPTLGQTAYQQLAAKPFYPDPPTIASGSLQYGSVATSSGFSSIEALFTQYPVTLTNTGDYIEMTVVFTNEANLMNAANGTLFFGLHNSGQVQPIPGGMNGNILNPTIGYAQNWQGYRSAIIYTGGAHSIATRPAQTVVATNNQDVLSGYSGAVTIATATSTLAPFTPGQQYTAVLRITKTGTSALTLVSTLYQGANTSGTQLFTQTGTTSSILTATFDALGIGYRAVGSVASIMAVNSIQIITTAPVPLQITSQPSPTNQSVLVGDSVTYSVAATGGVAAPSYQWQKSSNGGGTYTNIPGATGASYSMAGAAATDSGMYRVQVSDGAEQITSNAVTLTVAAPSAPQITAQPANATAESGSSASFTVQVSGNPQPAVQWQKSTDNGATFSDVGSSSQASPNTYTIPSAQASDAGLYRAVATNSQGSATSTAASLTVTGTSTDYYVHPSGQNGAYTTVTLAMQAVALATPAPTATKRAHVYIAPGIYNEQPSLSTPYVSLIGTGASAHDVVIAFPGVPNVPPTSFGATLTVARQATAFMATNLTFENSTADQNRTQALALRDSADLSIYYRCRFLGYQDTILLDQLSRHYFLECFITGDVDYIYGDGIAVFDKCLIQTTEAGYITAASTAPTTATGFVLFDCTLVPGVDRNFPADNTSLPPKNNIIKFGRPWQWSSGSRASVVFMRTKMAPHMMAKGWERWNLAEGANLTPDSNTRYAEFDSMDLHGTPLPLNTIPPTQDPNDNNPDGTSNDNDADPTGSTRVGVPVGRCGWAKAMTSTQAANYTLENIFGPASFWNTPGRQPDGFREAAASASGADPATFQYTDPVVAGRPATWDPQTQLLLLPR